MKKHSLWIIVLSVVTALACALLLAACGSAEEVKCKFSITYKNAGEVTYDLIPMPDESGVWWNEVKSGDSQSVEFCIRPGYDHSKVKATLNGEAVTPVFYLDSNDADKKPLPADYRNDDMSGVKCKLSITIDKDSELTVDFSACDKLPITVTLDSKIRSGANYAFISENYVPHSLYTDKDIPSILGRSNPVPSDGKIECKYLDTLIILTDEPYILSEKDNRNTEIHSMDGGLLRWNDEYPKYNGQYINKLNMGVRGMEDGTIIYIPKEIELSAQFDVRYDDMKNAVLVNYLIEHWDNFCGKFFPGDTKPQSQAVLDYYHQTLDAEITVGGTTKSYWGYDGFSNSWQPSYVYLGSAEKASADAEHVAAAKKAFGFDDMPADIRQEYLDTRLSNMDEICLVFVHDENVEYIITDGMGNTRLTLQPVSATLKYFDNATQYEHIVQADVVYLNKTTLATLNAAGGNIMMIARHTQAYKDATYVEIEVQGKDYFTTRAINIFSYYFYDYSVLDFTTYYERLFYKKELLAKEENYIKVMLDERFLNISYDFYDIKTGEKVLSGTSDESEITIDAGKLSTLAAYSSLRLVVSADKNNLKTITFSPDSDNKISIPSEVKLYCSYDCKNWKEVTQDSTLTISDTLYYYIAQDADNYNSYCMYMTVIVDEEKVKFNYGNILFNVLDELVEYTDAAGVNHAVSYIDLSNVFVYGNPAISLEISTEGI